MILPQETMWLPSSKALGIRATLGTYQTASFEVLPCYKTAAQSASKDGLGITKAFQGQGKSGQCSSAVISSNRPYNKATARVTQTRSQARRDFWSGCGRKRLERSE